MNEGLLKLAMLFRDLSRSESFASFAISSEIETLFNEIIAEEIKKAIQMNKNSDSEKERKIVWERQKQEKFIQEMKRLSDD